MYTFSLFARSVSNRPQPEWIRKFVSSGGCLCTGFLSNWVRLSQFREFIFPSYENSFGSVPESLIICSVNVHSQNPNSARQTKGNVETREHHNKAFILTSHYCTPSQIYSMLIKWWSDFLKLKISGFFNSTDTLTHRYTKSVEP